MLTFQPLGVADVQSSIDLSFFAKLTFLLTHLAKMDDVSSLAAE
jgi:hypothetical protein